MKINVPRAQVRNKLKYKDKHLIDRYLIGHLLMLQGKTNDVIDTTIYCWSNYLFGNLKITKLFLSMKYEIQNSIHASQVLLNIEV